MTKENKEIIPIEEQPYAVPENWQWVRLGEICNVLMGQSPKGSDTTDDTSFTPLIGGAADIENNFIQPKRYTRKATKLSKKNDIILCIRATLGNPVLSDGEYCLGRGVAAIRSKLCVKEFLRYFYCNFKQYLYDHATGSTFLSIGSVALKEMPLPVPPVEEQKRIVQVVNGQFSKLDKAKERIQSVLDSSETRKAAILHKAFTGELTASLRKEIYHHDDKSKINAIWKPSTLGQLFDLKAGKNIKASAISIKKTAEFPYPCFGGNGIRGYVATYNKEGEYPIIGRQGALCGNIHYAKGKFYATEHAVVVSCKNHDDSKCIMYYLVFLDLHQYNTATAQPGLAVATINKVSAVQIPYEEQREIVRILDDLLAKEQRITDIAKETLAQIDMMKQAILAKAFRGKLGTNDPSEPPAPLTANGDLSC